MRRINTRSIPVKMTPGHFNKKITNNLCCFWVHMKALTPLCQMRYDSLLYYGKWMCSRPKCNENGKDQSQIACSFLWGSNLSSKITRNRFKLTCTILSRGPLVDRDGQRSTLTSSLDHFGSNLRPQHFSLSISKRTCGLERGERQCFVGR